MSVIPGQSVKKIGATYDWCAKKVLFQASGGLTKIKISHIMYIHLFDPKCHSSYYLILCNILPVSDTVFLCSCTDKMKTSKSGQAYGLYHVS